VSSAKPFYSDDSKRAVARDRSLSIFATNRSIIMMSHSSIWTLFTSIQPELEARNGVQTSVLTKKDKSYADGDQENSQPPLEADSLMQEDDSSNGTGNVTQCRYRNNKADVVQG
jgi:hypothetical protein